MKLFSLSLFLAVATALRQPSWSDYLLSEREFVHIAKRQVTKSCKVVPSSSNWPTESGWQTLRNAVNGKLTKTIPPAAACHNTFDGQSTYNQQACQQVKSGWSNQDWHFNHPSGVSILWPNWSNNTCLPGDSPSAPCTIGKYPLYVVEAETVAHVQTAINWARNNNIRLVVRNTGHCFMGKSTGAGSMSVWVHKFKNIEFVSSYNKEGEPWKGTAVKVGAAWQVGELYKTLYERRQVVVAGECAGVGFAGGYIQGGGHGPLSSLYGMGSDNALEFELVTADGEFKVANRVQNPDLFWALRGGGGASWGVVTSVTVKTYPELRTTGNSISISGNVNNDIFWGAMEFFHTYALDLIAKDIYIYYEMGSFGFTKLFNVAPILAPGKSAAELNTLLKPLFDRWSQIGFPYTQTTREFNSFYESYIALFSGEGAGTSMLTSGRIITRDNIRTNAKPIMSLFREITDAGRFIIGHVLAPGNHNVDTVGSAVHPAWKEHAYLPLWTTTVQGNENASQMQSIISQVNSYEDRMKAITPGGGSYLNEGNIFDPQWAKEMYGANWERLRDIKERVDPLGVFYAEAAVGAQNWRKSGQWDQLCPV